MQLIEQTLLVVLVIGRWILPKGSITRDELSQLLLAYLAISSDIVELFNLFEVPQVRLSMKLTWIILTLWSVSLVQFPLILTTAKGQKARYCWAANPNEGKNVKLKVKAQAYAKLNSEQSDSEEEDTGCIANTKARLSSGAVWGILSTVILQDGPFLGLRLYLIFYCNVSNYTLLFFVCKNALIMCVQLYRLIVICVEFGVPLEPKTSKLKAILENAANNSNDVGKITTQTENSGSGPTKTVIMSEKSDSNGSASKQKKKPGKLKSKESKISKASKTSETSKTSKESKSVSKSSSGNETSNHEDEICKLDENAAKAERPENETQKTEIMLEKSAEAAKTPESDSKKVAEEPTKANSGNGSNDLKETGKLDKNGTKPHETETVEPTNIVEKVVEKNSDLDGPGSKPKTEYGKRNQSSLKNSKDRKDLDKSVAKTENSDNKPVKSELVEADSVSGGSNAKPKKSGKNKKLPEEFVIKQASAMMPKCVLKSVSATLIQPVIDHVSADMPESTHAEGKKDDNNFTSNDSTVNHDSELDKETKVVLETSPDAEPKRINGELEAVIVDLKEPKNDEKPVPEPVIETVPKSESKFTPTEKDRYEPSTSERVDKPVAETVAKPDSETLSDSIKPRRFNPSKIVIKDSTGNWENLREISPTNFDVDSDAEGPLAVSGEKSDNHLPDANAKNSGNELLTESGRTVEDTNNTVQTEDTTKT